MPNSSSLPASCLLLRRSNDLICTGAMELYRSPGETGDDGIGAQQQSPRVVVSRTLFSFLGGENKHESRHFKKLGREAKLNVRRCYMKNAVGPSVSSAAPWSLHGDACLRLRIWIGLKLSIPFSMERVGWSQEGPYRAIDPGGRKQCCRSQSMAFSGV